MSTRSRLTPEERERYSRHLALPGFGEDAQLRLRQARVLVVGCGGLGNPVIAYLAAAGVGHIGLADGDVVETSNLQRQILFTMEECGQSKASVAAQKVNALNPLVQTTVYPFRITADNALEIAKDYDVIADCTDRIPTRYLLSDTAVLADKVLVHAGVFRTEGQLAVFHGKMNDSLRSANYRDIFPEPPYPDAVMSCAEGGVLGALTGILGTMQAMEIIKVITGYGEPLYNQLLMIDALTMESRVIRFSRRPDNPLTGDTPTQHGLIDYDQFCGIKNEQLMREITAGELKAMQEKGESFVLIDVREPYEYAAKNLGGELIPLGEIPESVHRIPKEGTVILICRAGVRSAHAIDYLSHTHGYTNLINLRGGILAWTE
ncbi:MAG: ThiF family adenylyltransferase [Flavobacteriales bacterium]